jgi:hypothetical protein
VTHIYGYYSNKSRGMRKKVGMDDQVPVLVEDDTYSQLPPIDSWTQ